MISSFIILTLETVKNILFIYMNDERRKHAIKAENLDPTHNNGIRITIAPTLFRRPLPTRLFTYLL